MSVRTAFVPCSPGIQSARQHRTVLCDRRYKHKEYEFPDCRTAVQTRNRKARDVVSSSVYRAHGKNWSVGNRSSEQFHVLSGLIENVAKSGRCDEADVFKVVDDFLKA